MGFRDEQLKVEEMIEHMLYVLRTEETDAMTSRPTHDAGVIIGNVNRQRKIKGKSRNNDGRSRGGTFAEWCRRHPGKCLRCEQSGHLQSNCPEPLPLSKLSDDNPLKAPRKLAGNRNGNGAPNEGAFVVLPSSAYHVHAAPGPSIDYIVDTGAAHVSYMPSAAGFDERSLKILEKPVPISGVGGTATVTATGTAYAKTVCYDGKKNRVLTIRFEAAVVPALQASGIGLLST